MRSEHELNHSPQSSAEVKNEWRCTFALPLCLRGVDSDNLTFLTGVIKLRKVAVVAWFMLRHFWYLQTLYTVEVSTAGWSCMMWKEVVVAQVRAIEIFAWRDWGKYERLQWLHPAFRFSIKSVICWYESNRTKDVARRDKRCGTPSDAVQGAADVVTPLNRTSRCSD
jgi:hypothetical protein